MSSIIKMVGMSMSDTLVSFETAKLAKEKGFNELVRHCFLQDAELCGTISLLEDDDIAFIDVMDGNELEYHNHKDFDRYSAPTQSLLQKWLREVHNINVYCMPCESDYKEGQWFNNIASHNPPFTGTYEEALEIGLFQALKLI